MAFVTGLMLIDAPASALNNVGSVPGRLFDNVAGVKAIRTKDGVYPYVSAQAFKYWLRTTLEKADLGWQAAPIYREEKVAYTDANPIRWWDDDLFGYMRAPSTKASAIAKRQADETRADETPTVDTVTRVAPFRMSTLVSIAPVTIVEDWEVMARHEGDPVPYSSQFYRTTLKGVFSLDLRASGTFSYRRKTGYRNLDDVRSKEAEEKGLTKNEEQKTFSLPTEERLQRINALFEGLALLNGGAKQALHYTDVAPSLTVLAVVKGGNNIFGFAVGANSRGLPEFKVAALEEVLRVYEKDILSDVHIGWVRGYLDDERTKVDALAQRLEKEDTRPRLRISHPRDAFRSLVENIRQSANLSWLS